MSDRMSDGAWPVLDIVLSRSDRGVSKNRTAK